MLRTHHNGVSGDIGDISCWFFIKDFVLGPEHQRQYAEVNRQQHDRVIRACFIVVDASRLYKIVNLFT